MINITKDNFLLRPTYDCSMRGDILDEIPMHSCRLSWISQRNHARLLRLSFSAYFIPTLWCQIQHGVHITGCACARACGSECAVATIPHAGSPHVSFRLSLLNMTRWERTLRRSFQARLPRIRWKKKNEASMLEVCRDKHSRNMHSRMDTLPTHKSNKKSKSFKCW